MAIEYKITKSGDRATKHFDFTVVFQTSHIGDGDIEAIRREAQMFLERRNIGHRINREVNVFVKNRKAIALVHYDNVSTDLDEGRVETDFPGVVSHLTEILEMFDVPAA